jgi:hypothetical protein
VDRTKPHAVLPTIPRPLRRLLVVAATLVVAVAAATPVARAQPRPLLVGFEDEPSFLWSADRLALLARAAAAHASIVRVVAQWNLIAPHRPRNPTSPADPAYHFEGIDDLIWHAQLHGMRVLLTVWGTPSWASASRKVNAAPAPAALAAFCSAVATRYSGHYRGQPFVPYYSVWNEPNLEQFLSPQFDAEGRDRAPELYAAMFRSCYSAIKAASPHAVVAIGETAPRGHDAPRSDVQASHSPGRFAALLAKVRPRLRFDAWAHHPYPPGFRGSPTAPLRWPDVGVGNLQRFEQTLRTLFKVPAVPLWLTEFAYQTAPERRGALSYSQQASYLERAFDAAVSVRSVRMFIWYVFRDTPGQRWQSGLLRSNDAAKPSLAAFTRLAAEYDVANPTLTIPPKPDPAIRLSVIDFLADRLPGDPELGMTYRVFDSRGGLVAVAQPRAAIGAYGYITVTLDFTPRPGHRYNVTFDLNDIHGHTAARRARLIVPAAARRTRRRVR